MLKRRHTALLRVLMALTMSRYTRQRTLLR